MGSRHTAAATEGSLWNWQTHGAQAQTVKLMETMSGDAVGRTLQRPADNTAEYTMVQWPCNQQRLLHATYLTLADDDGRWGVEGA